MGILIKAFLIVLMTLFLFSFTQRSEAVLQATDSGATKVNHVAGLFEKISEKITLMFKFNKEDKANYYQELLNKRLGEIQYIIDNGQGDLIEETSSRYATYIGTVSDFIMANKLSSKKNSLNGMLDEHLKILQERQSKFEFESGWWLLLQHDINLVKNSKDKINSL